MVYIPEGEFTMGSSSQSERVWTEYRRIVSNNEFPQRTVTIDAYWIDETEVTFTMFSRCIDLGVCSPSQNKDDDGVHQNLPQTNVDWFQAMAYCEWVGGSLPTEAQWEKAARGAEARKFPWGSNFPSEQYTNVVRSSMDLRGVGSFPKGASPFGVLDMAGNAFEWVKDWYGENYYKENISSNPMGPKTGIEKTIRGISTVKIYRDTLQRWRQEGRYADTTIRSSQEPDYTSDVLGFRCAYPAD